MAMDQGTGFLLTRRAQLSPERTALAFGEESWTYAALNGVVNRAAHGLRALGVNPGDRVGYLGLNHPRFFVSMFATAKLGAIFVPLNWRLTPPELCFMVGDAGVHTLIYGEEFSSVVDAIHDQVPCREFVCGAARAHARAFDELLHDQRDSELDCQIERGDVCWIMYTSGTTGRPKGAMITHDNILWNNLNASLVVDSFIDDVTLVVAPLFHIGGLNVTPMGVLMKGGKVVVEPMFEPGRVLELIDKHRVTTMFGVPAMFQFMAQHPDWATRDLSSLRLLACGGAPVPESLIRLYGDRGIVFSQGYGLTETSPFACFLPVDKALEKVGSAGVAPFFSEVRVVDDDDREVPDGERGEIVVRGPNVMKGYWNRPDATSEAIVNGWFHTGDVGTRDADGYFTIVDRKKDMIITGGENVYPAEVEDCLYSHPAIRECAVIGVSDPTWGETVRAVVVLKEGATGTAEELIDFTQGRLARYKQPKSLVFTHTLPRNPAGKVLKAELRERFGAPSSVQVEHEAHRAAEVEPRGADSVAEDEPVDHLVTRRRGPRDRDSRDRSFGGRTGGA